MSDEAKHFTVTDRRHFTADGAPRQEDAPVEPERPAAPDAAPLPGDLVPLFLSLASQAGVLLNPEGGAERPDLRGAQAVISLLELLQDRTQGRRTADEEAVLSEILFNLRMAYLGSQRGAA
jgi:hypothetical protein